MERIAAARVVTPEGVRETAGVTIDGAFISAVEPTGVSPDRLLCPGFVDLQVNGHGPVSVWDADDREWGELERRLLAQGVTTWCPTLGSRRRHAYPEAFERLARRVQRDDSERPFAAGIHLEGPFLSPDCRGAHDAEALAPVDPGWLSELPETVRVVTLAPELPGALGAIEQLASRGVLVSLGHSNADAETTGRAAEAGARLVTHLFNAMRRFHHRDPGIVGAALTDDRLTVSLIPDLVHVDRSALALAFRAKGPDRVVLITDAVAADDDVGEPPRLPDGTLTGSVLTMDRALANAVSAGVALEDAVAAVSTNPARSLGLDDRGRIVSGGRADLVALTSDLAVEAVWVGGRLVYDADAGE